MEHPPIEILVVDDEASIRWVIEKTLAEGGYGLHFAESAEAAQRLVDGQHIDFALVDINLPGDDGFTFLQAQQQRHPDLLMAVITGESTMNNAVTAMKLGAFDYLTKPFDIDEIEALVARAAHAIRAGRRQQPVAAEPGPTGEGEPITGRSHATREVYKAIGRVAGTDVGVLIQGESGTGKELIARSVHQHSGRAREPFVAVNCAAIPRELLESELFGYEKGAFTGAVERKAGRLETAGKGTIFLDEIGDMPLELQAKLLRVLQEREFQRVGGLNTLALRARVLAASNRELLQSVESGAFRADLYYRLSQFTIAAAPLRERREDIPPLVEHFLRLGATKLGLPARGITPEALERLVSHDWPGNVRELENVIKSLMIMTRTPVIDVADLPRNISGGEDSKTLDEKFEQSVLHHWGALIRDYSEQGKSGLLHRLEAHLERPLIRQVLHLTHGNQVKASAILGINRNTLRSKMQALGIRKPTGGRSARTRGKTGHDGEA